MSENRKKSLSFGEMTVETSQQSVFEQHFSSIIYRMISLVTQIVSTERLVRKPFYCDTNEMLLIVTRATCHNLIDNTWNGN